MSGDSILMRVFNERASVRAAVGVLAAAALAWPAGAEGRRSPAERELRLTPENRTEVRDKLREAVFGSSRLPRIESELELSDRDFEGAARVRSVTLSAAGITSRGHLLRPAHRRGELMVHHSGHARSGSVLDVAEREIRFFLRRGYDVLALAMPLHNDNYLDAPPPVLDRCWVAPFDHSGFACHPRPLYPFVAPVVAALNRLDYNRAAMSGLSGGGWTTVVAAAVDPRIDRSYPVAGSWPTYLRERSDDPSDLGDFEQRHPPMLEAASYLDMYALTRRQLQVFNQHDDCCFRGAAFRTYERVVRGVQPSFDAVLDRKAEGHEFSRWALRLVAADLRR